MLLVLLFAWLCKKYHKSVRVTVYTAIHACIKLINGIINIVHCYHGYRCAAISNINILM